MKNSIQILSFILIATIGFGPGAIAQQSTKPGTTQPRQWPSQSGPQHPIEVRICSCRYAGESIPIGKTICMKFEGKHVKARCDSVVNNPSWSISTEECPSS